MTKHSALAPVAGKFRTFDFGNATDILADKHPELLGQIVSVLSGFSFSKSDILKGGGSKSPIAKRINSAFNELGWGEQKYTMEALQYGGETYAQETHIIDCCNGRVVLEIEWNNKDAFFYRDIASFQHLYESGEIDCGVIVTRATELQKFFNGLSANEGLSKTKYGKATTHHQKLIPLLVRRSAAACPVLVFVITEGALS